jgi:hypothetical protein
MVVFLGKGSLCGGGYWVLAQAALKGGNGWRGLSGTQHLSPVLPGKGLRPLHSMNKSRTLDPPLCY